MRSVPRPRRDVMRGARRLARETLHPFLDRAVGPGDALMLPQVIEPGVGEPDLDDPLRVRGVLEYVPVVATVAPTLAGERHECGEERFAVFGRNVVLDRDQHWAGGL